MRQIRSSGSVKAISLNRDEVIRQLREVATEALATFPDLQEVWLIGSLAAGTQTGTSDADLVLRVASVPDNPLEALKPYFFFFSRRIELSLDILLAGGESSGEIEQAFRGGILLAARG